MAEVKQTINGKYYDWSSISVEIPGLDLTILEISYDDELEKEEIYGKGNRPRGYGTGNYKASGKLTLQREDYDKLLAYCKSKNISFFSLVIPSIVVSYANGIERMRIDELKKVLFTKRSNKAAQGDKGIKVDIDLMIIGGIVQDGVEPV